MDVDLFDLRPAPLQGHPIPRARGPMFNGSTLNVGKDEARLSRDTAILPRRHRDEQNLPYPSPPSLTHRNRTVPTTPIPLRRHNLVIKRRSQLQAQLLPSIKMIFRRDCPTNPFRRPNRPKLPKRRSPDDRRRVGASRGVDFIGSAIGGDLALVCEMGGGGGVVAAKGFEDVVLFLTLTG